MRKNDIFTFTAPNGVEVQAIVVDETHVYHLPNEDARLHTYLCYGQNRLFYYAWLEGFIRHTPEEKCWEASEYSYVNKLVDYCILPNYDELLARYNNDKADSYEEAVNIVIKQQF